MEAKVDSRGDVRKVYSNVDDRSSGAVMKKNPEPRLPEILTVEEISELLRVHPSTIYRMLKRKEIPGFKVGNDWRFQTGNIRQWLDQKARNSRDGVAK
ncbi:MAG: helix-turn-helix domain-containing protein [Candidatus Binatus sp.]